MWHVTIVFDYWKRSYADIHRYGLFLVLSPKTPSHILRAVIFIVWTSLSCINLFPTSFQCSVDYSFTITSTPILLLVISSVTWYLSYLCTTENFVFSSLNFFLSSILYLYLQISEMGWHWEYLFQQLSNKKKKKIVLTYWP